MPRCTPPSSSTSSTSSLAPRRSWSPSCSYSLISPFTPWAPLLPRSHLPNPPWRRSLRWSTRSSQSSRHSGSDATDLKTAFSIDWTASVGGNSGGKVRPVAGATGEATSSSRHRPGRVEQYHRKTCAGSIRRRWARRPSFLTRWPWRRAEMARMFVLV
jgi:hypothetical protein